MKICGVDEAGRGPVIGPLAIAGVLATEEQIQQFEEMGVKDSKLLTPIQIERMAVRIKDIAESYRVILVEPAEIDDAVSEKNATSNLNWLEADKTIEILEELKPEESIIDCPATIPAKYEAYLRERLKITTKLICEHKADANHIVAGAASILAKAAREEAIEKLQKEHNVMFGSGYPSDPKTKAFLEKNWDKYNFFRKTWESFKRIEKNKSQTKLV